MRAHLHLLFIMLHFSRGCDVSDVSQTKVISGYSGGSVLLPCSCAQPQSTVHTFSWQFQQTVNTWISVFENQKYRDRLVLFNESSPTNLSLLISDLRKTDEGYYKCLTEQNTPTFVQLTVQGCDLVNTGKTVELTGNSGESVLLPCSCTELLTKPEHIQWMYMTENNYKEIYPKEEVESHKNRVKLLNQNTPGNLSLLISALTIKHQGTYYCSVSPQQIVYFILTVKENPYTHPISSTTHEPPHHFTNLPAAQPAHNTLHYVFILLGIFLSVLLLTLLVFIYWRCRGGRTVKKEITKESNDGEALKKEPDSQDDVMYSTVVYVKTASKESDTQHH
ncbi:uncharacterized protein LOC556440 precursor [Danio rerio]|uniref:Uncharacterized protein LOC556440 precursor n=5 Tax=Danio rerio TaxID=7955 RepID=A0A8M1NCP0_DANRE|nr:uncharacterized protein LOC556440 precursor [Danio rerio]|eukprot:NP_001077293.2 uncharacterized protein LOC556440 precursor [Danio rerio]